MKFIKLIEINPQRNSDDLHINKIRSSLKNQIDWSINLMNTKYTLNNYIESSDFEETIIDLDEIAQIKTKPIEVLVVQSKTKYTIINMYRIRVKTGRGRGINGIDHNMFIIEDSFNSLISKIQID